MKIPNRLVDVVNMSFEEFTKIKKGIKKGKIKDEGMRIDFNMPENIRAFDDDSSEDFQIPAKKTFDDWDYEENKKKKEKKEKNPLLTFEEYLQEKFWRIIEKLKK